MSKKQNVAAYFGLLGAVLALFIQGASVSAEQVVPPEESADPWSVVELLVGSWEGEIDGKLGTGRGVRRYELIMGDRFLLCRHLSVRLPQPKSPAGDQHEELAVFSFDGDRQKLMYREFMSEGEGIVVRSTCTVDGKKVVCTSEAVEDGPGIRARLTLDIADRYRFTETYELAGPGQELELYFRNQWTRSTVPNGWD